MSIYCSVFEVGFEHKRKCKYDLFSKDVCTCGACPIFYQGSHILPSDRHMRKGEIGIAAIPDHITRDGSDDKPEKGKWQPWLRVHLSKGSHGGDTIILTKKQVEAFRDALNAWLERT